MLAAIDAGSNTLRLLIGDVAGNTIKPHIYHRRITRLAGDFSTEEGLSRDARVRTLSAFQEFADLCREAGVSKCLAVGTAAFRNAVNGQAFVDEIQSCTGIELDIISGSEEASLMAAGVLSVVAPLPKASLVVDIGGGSTEFVLCLGKQVLWQTSLPLGVVTLTETVTPPEKDKTIEQAVDLLLLEINEQMASAGYPSTPLQLIGTAGTVTTLAALDMQMDDYDWQRVNNYTIEYGRISKWHSDLSPLTVAERERLPGMEQGRGDLIMAGIDIVLCVMSKLECTSLVVSDFGLLEGVLQSLVETGKT